ncbi:DinB family protein [Tamlana sp. I1]|uniref:DinB family protein n=1 Tax=Tamlana sp. I1 TaxID=2762061 RepID=UPI001890A83E|nr:DinB family protein [Tamlana sp. I1]
MKVTELKSTEYHPYYKTYIVEAPTDFTLLEGFSKGKEAVLAFFKSIPNTKLDYAYQPGKWTIKEVFQHIIDNERVFIYRCLRLSRQDKTPLPGYHQDDYIAPSKASLKSIEALIEEYEAVRQNSIVFIKSLSDSDLKQIGTVSDHDMSARAAAFIILGHEKHHISVLKSRYLSR